MIENETMHHLTKKCTLKEKHGCWFIAKEKTLWKNWHIFCKCCKYLSMHTKGWLRIDTMGKKEHEFLVPNWYGNQQKQFKFDMGV